MLRSATVPLCLVLAAIPVAARAAAALPQQQVDRIFAQWNQATPGCAVGIAQRGKPVLMRAIGMQTPGVFSDGRAHNYGLGLFRPASIPPLFAPDRSARPAQAGAAELAELAGTYRSAEADAVYRLYSSGRKRQAGRARAHRRDLAAVG
jgi:hypothetical protein